MSRGGSLRKPHIASYALVAIALAGPPRVSGAQQDGLTAYPANYHLQFENDWVRLVRVKLPRAAHLDEHTHPGGYMVHVYLNDADPITFFHTQSAAGTINRPAVTARSYRVGLTRDEIHAVTNIGRGLTDYLRIELKTQGRETRAARIAAPPIGVHTAAEVEVTNSEIRITRVTVGQSESYEVAADSAPALLIALTDNLTIDGAAAMAIGQERFVDAGKRAVLRPKGFTVVQALRVDFLTKPAKPAP